MPGSSDRLCFGGALLIVGLFSRPVSLMVFISMTVAYVTADMEAFSSFVSDPDKFVKADPFVFWFAALIVLAFGPGLISLDALGKSIFRKPDLTSTASSRDLR